MDPSDSTPKDPTQNPTPIHEAFPAPEPPLSPASTEPATTPPSPSKKTNAAAETLTKLLVRLAVIVAVTWAWGEFLNLSVKASAGATTPPGFTEGLLHGALMPGAMPMLLLGRNVAIYTDPNQGREFDSDRTRRYNLGYTAGVNACGLIFFGILFRRVGRIKKRYASRKQ